MATERKRRSKDLRQAVAEGKLTESAAQERARHEEATMATHERTSMTKVTPMIWGIIVLCNLSLMYHSS